MSRKLIGAALLALSSPALAQSVDVNQMIAVSSQAVQMVDQGKSADLWESFSPAIKRIAPKANFIAGVDAERRPFGTPVSRVWVSASQLSVEIGRAHV